MSISYLERTYNKYGRSLFKATGLILRVLYYFIGETYSLMFLL